MKEKLKLSDGDLMDLIIITGLSGAGKSTVVDAMEDIGYFCVDNIPAKLIPTLAFSLIKEGGKKRAAIVSDVRAGITPDDLKDALAELAELKITYKLLFVDCSCDVIHNRFRLSRRTHPLNDECICTEDAISIEKKLMKPLRQMSDFVIDTTLMSHNSLKNRVFDLFKELEGAQRSGVKLHIVSFGFKHGIPLDADYVFDVRSLPNPYYVDELKELTGLDEKVSGFVMSFPEAKDFEKRLKDFLQFSVPLCIKDGRSQLVIAIGCTGGHHRSVTFAENLYKYFETVGYNVSLSHRDINK